MPNQRTKKIYHHTARPRNTLNVPVCQRNQPRTFLSLNARPSMVQSSVKRVLPLPRQQRCASSCTLTRVRRLFWADLRVRLSSMFPDSSPQHFTTTIMSPPNIPVALKITRGAHSYTKLSLVTPCQTVVHPPP